MSGVGHHHHGTASSSAAAGRDGTAACPLCHRRVLLRRQSLEAHLQSHHPPPPPPPSSSSSSSSSSSLPQPQLSSTTSSPPPSLASSGGGGASSTYGRKRRRTEPRQTSTSADAPQPPVVIINVDDEDEGTAQPVLPLPPRPSAASSRDGHDDDDDDGHDDGRDDVMNVHSLDPLQQALQRRHHHRHRPSSATVFRPIERPDEAALQLRNEFDFEAEIEKELKEMTRQFAMEEEELKKAAEDLPMQPEIFDFFPAGTRTTASQGPTHTATAPSPHKVHDRRPSKRRRNEKENPMEAIQISTREKKAEPASHRQTAAEKAATSTEGSAPGSASTASALCPICNIDLKTEDTVIINRHVDECLTESMLRQEQEASRASRPQRSEAPRAFVAPRAPLPPSSSWNLDDPIFAPLQRSAPTSSHAPLNPDAIAAILGLRNPSSPSRAAESSSPSPSVVAPHSTAAIAPAGFVIPAHSAPSVVSVPPRVSSQRCHCPYSNCENSIKMRRLAKHVKKYHRNDTESVSCPICKSQIGSLLEHLNEVHDYKHGSYWRRPPYPVRSVEPPLFGVAPATAVVDAPKTTTTTTTTQNVSEFATTRVLSASLPEDKSECLICFENLAPGETVAYLQCLCIYHESCVKLWWEKQKKVECPTHRCD